MSEWVRLRRGKERGADILPAYKPLWGKSVVQATLRL